MNKIILILIALLFIPIVGAVDNPFYVPTCINPSYDDGWTTVISSNNATNGEIRDVNFGTDGYFSGGNQRVYGGINILCAASDPTTVGLLGGTQRLFGTSEDGSVWYTDTPNLNYSTGFYNPGYLGCGVDGNCNDLRKVASLSAIATTKPLAIDSNGNVFVSNDDTIVKLVKSLSYSPQLFYDVGYSSADLTYIILDIKIDTTDKVHFVVGGYDPAYAIAHGSTFAHFVVNSDGTLYSSNTLATQSFFGTNYGYRYGGLILDSINPIQNYTYMITNNTGVYTTYIKHNSTAGTTDVVSGALTTITIGQAIYYTNHQVYVAAPIQNIIRSYITTFAGQLPGSISSSTPAELTYSQSTIDILETSYYNNTPIAVNINVVVDLSGQSLAEDLLNTQENYRWKMQLNDPNGAQAAFHLSSVCTEIGFSCFMNETLSISPPSNNWTSGIYTAYLKEYNIDTYAEATLAIDTTTVLNTSTNNTGIMITEPITSGTGTTALSSIDSWTALFGLGVNPISKFLFALVLILAAMFFGYIATRYSTMGGIIAAALPFCFFVFISYIPVWTIVIVVLIIALKGKWVG